MPTRTAAGHRRYTPDTIDQARLVLRLQRAGLSLAEIRLLADGDRDARESVVAERLARLTTQVTELQHAIGFLEHTRSCRHRIIASCPECEAYVEADHRGRRSRRP